MKWPRGKYNGQRIAGISMRFELDVFEWNFKPVLFRQYGVLCLYWLCCMIVIEWAYETGDTIDVPF